MTETRRRVCFLLPDEPRMPHVYVWRLVEGELKTPVYVGMSTIAGLGRALSHAKGALDLPRQDGERFRQKLSHIICDVATLDLDIVFESEDPEDVRREEARLIGQYGMLRNGDGTLHNLNGGTGSSRKKELTALMSSASQAVARTWLDPEVKAKRLDQKHTLVNGILFSSFRNALHGLGIEEKFALNHILLRTDLNKQPPGTRLRRWGLEITNVPKDPMRLADDNQRRLEFSRAYQARLAAGEFDAAEDARGCHKNRTLDSEFVRCCA